MKQIPFIQSNPALLRIIACAIILLTGTAGMQVLASFKKPPAEAKKEERPIQVEVKKVTAASVKVTIAGHGEAKALDIVAIAPEIGGRLTFVHENAEPGGIIPAGEPLFSIDKRNFSAARDEAQATVRQLEQTVARLRKQYETDAQRLLSLERNRQLAHDDFIRVKDLFEIDKVGTRAGVDAKEQASNNTADLADKLAQSVALYPLQIGEAQQSLEAARTRLSLAEANLERCTVVAPFTGRVKETSIEKGQYVNPGQALMTLANDAVLEIQVSLDSRDAKRWLHFSNQLSQPDTAWFQELPAVPCAIYWTEDRTHFWQGTLDRVVRFDEKTRTITVAIRIEAANAQPSASGALPLVEGMFCEVRIPGRTMTEVYTLPRWAVSFQNTVYLAVNSRLRTREVHVAWTDADAAYIDQGLVEGDLVIVTRLVNPLESALLTFTAPDKEDGK